MYSKHSEHFAHAQPAEHAKHDQHAGHRIAMFRQKFWVCLLLTIPALAWGHMLQQAIRYTAPDFPGAMWIPSVFGTAVFVYGWVFMQGAVREVRDRLPGMMTLIALAISVAFAFSAFVSRQRIDKVLDGRECGQKNGGDPESLSPLLRAVPVKFPFKSELHAEGARLVLRVVLGGVICDFLYLGWLALRSWRTR